MANIYTEPKNKIKNPVIIDLGCNIGYESLKLWNLWVPSLLISVDPFVYNIEKTRELMLNNTTSPYWLLNCCAVSDKNGEAVMSHKFSSNTNNSPCGGITVDGNKYCEEDELVTVKTKTLHEIYSNPDILKVDIEGHEWYIWDQLINTESIKIIFLELHATHTLSCEQMKAKIEELKKVYNLRWFKYAQSQKLEMDDAEETDESVFDCNGYCHVLCERK